MAGKFRIVEAEYADGEVKYILEQFLEDSGTWKSCYRHTDLQVIRDAKTERETGGILKSRVIE